MNIGDKVAEESQWDGEGPHHESLVPPVVQEDDLLERPLEAGGALYGRRGRGGEDGDEGQGAEDEDGGEDREHLEAALEAVVLEDVLVHVAEADGEEGAAGRHDSVDEAHSSAEVVAEDGEGGRVDQACTGSEHDAVSEVEVFNLIGLGIE